MLEKGEKHEVIGQFLYIGNKLFKGNTLGSQRTCNELLMLGL